MYLAFKPPRQQLRFVTTKHILDHKITYHNYVETTNDSAVLIHAGEKRSMETRARPMDRQERYTKKLFKEENRSLSK